MVGGSSSRRAQRPASFSRRLASAILTSSLGLSAAWAEPREAEARRPVAQEYQVKAVFLFRFIQFIEWPKDAPQTHDASICIGVLGDDPFGSALDEVVRNEVVQTRKLAVRRSLQPEDLKKCALVFVSPSEQGRMSSVIAALGSAPVVTVSEVPGFARLGGVFNFFLEGKKVRFEINPAAAKRHGLRVSSELLKLGRIVDSEPPRGGTSR
jgi:hypothetical protein